MNKNKKIFNSVVQNNMFVNHDPKRKLSTISKSSKDGNTKKSSKDHGSNYSIVKDKFSSQSNYNPENSKHKRSSSDSQKLYDLNKWSNFNMPVAKQKWKTNENSSRLKSGHNKTRKAASKDRMVPNVSSQYDRSIERNSIQLDKFYNPHKGYDNSDMILVTPRSFNWNGSSSGIIKFKISYFLG